MIRLRFCEAHRNPRPDARWFLSFRRLETNCRSDELTGTSVDWAALPQLPYDEFVLKHLFEVNGNY